MMSVNDKELIGEMVFKTVFHGILVVRQLTEQVLL